MMDHNLEESLNLEDVIGAEDNVGECEINLDAESGTQMEFEQIVEQPMFMETENEEVIVPDFIDDQFSLQEYSIQDESQDTGANTVVETTIPGEESSMEYENQVMTISTSRQPKLISVKLQPIPGQQVTGTTTAIPRQVAIAPKPTKVIPSTAVGVGKQFVLQQKIQTHVVPNKDSLVKKPIAGVIQAPSRGNFVSVMPKIKLVSSIGQNMQYAQIIRQPGNPINKQGFTKLVIQGTQTRAHTPAMVTKVVSQPTRVLTMQQKTVPVSISNEIPPSRSPTKTQKIKLAKVQQIALKSPRTTPANSEVGHTLTKKIVVTSQPSVSKPVVNITKEKQEAGTIRMHPIHVPGKGVQYIQVITKPPASAANKPVVVITDGSKGPGIKNKIIQIGDKVISGPPPLVYTNSSGATLVNPSVSGKGHQKYVRIAPIGSKTAQAFLQKNRPSQSLLAPMSPATKTPETASELLTAIKMEQVEGKAEDRQESVDPGEALRALVADAVGEHNVELTKVKKDEIDYDDAEETVIEEMTTEHELSTTQDYDDSNFSVSQDYSANQDYGENNEYTVKCDYSASDTNASHNAGRNTPLIVVPSSFVKRIENKESHLEEIPVQVRISNYDSEVPTAELVSRPRRACKCTKSQCLKLYCDCFANGEFCNKCNCINCHNNLANEELRQKAIRGCLDRNPHAFKPKIGKAKTGGIDIIRRHITGCNCKRSGCLKNYCECFEAKIACSAMCKCVGCRNVEEALPRRHHMHRAPPVMPRQPCSFMTNEVIEAVCQCLIAAAKDGGARPASPGAPAVPGGVPGVPGDPVRSVIEEFSRCLQDIIGAAHHPESHTSILDELGA